MPMHKLAKWFQGALSATRISKSERNMDDEMRFHVEMETADLQRSGISAGEANEEP